MTATRIRMLILGCAAIGGLCGFSTGAIAAQVEVAPELERLAAEHGFEVTGAEHLQDAVGRAEGDEPFARLRLLLERFDHIILQAPDGNVARVIVLGEATPGAVIPKTVIDGGAAAGTEDGDGDAESEEPTDVELATVRNGSQHSVAVALEGPNGERVERLMLIDTGADTVVLPKSLIAELGIDERRLGSRQVQTANGRAQARSGRLTGSWLGEQRLGNIEVAFLDDENLGTSGLLGMNVLGRYQMTIDDESNTLRLTRR
jgi:clan AA aspartic protease (TIGR02281 family)